jgi:hypothetical protein
MSLFSVPTDNLFTDLGKTPTEPTIQPLDVEQVNTSARIAALANVDTKSPSLLNDLNDLNKGYSDLISQVGDTQLRQEAAANQQLGELHALTKLNSASPGFDPTLTPHIAEASSQVIAEGVQRRQEYVLEQKAVENIQNLAAQGDVTQAKLLLNNMEHGDTNQVMVDRQTKKLILQRELQKAQINKDDQPWYLDMLNTVIDLTGNIGSSAAQGGNVDVAKSMKHWYDGLLSGQRVANEGDTLWNMPAADFAVYVRDHLIPNVKEHSTILGFENKSTELQTLTKLNNFKPVQVGPGWEVNRAAVENTSNAVDNLGWVIGTPIAKAVNIPGLLIRNGARKGAAEALAKAATEMATEGVEVAAARNGITDTDIAAEVLPGAVNDIGTSSTVGLSNEAVSVLERTRKLIDELPNLTQPGRFSNQAEFQTAVDSITSKIAEDYDRPIKDLEVVTKQLSDKSNVYGVDFKLGRTSGAGFANAGQAQKYARSLGYQEAKIVADESGQFFVSLTRDMPETAFWTNTLNVKATNYLARLTLNARMLGDEMLANIAQVSGNNKAKLLKSLYGDQLKPFTKMSKAQHEAVGQVLALGENRGQWFSDDELGTLYRRAYNREVTAEELDAYRSAVNINDIDHSLRNDELYKKRLIDGHETVTFNTGLKNADRINAKIVRGVPESFEGNAFNISESTSYGRNTQPDIQRLKDEGYYFIRTEDPVELADGSKVNAFFAKPHDLNIEPLRRDQLAYRAGGHRIYKGKYFAKQAVVEDIKGVTTYQNPKTHIVGQTHAEVDFWANKMEAARIAYNNKADATVLDEILEGRAGFPTGEEFINNMESGNYSKNTPFRAMYDREELPEYVMNSSADDFRIKDDYGTEQNLRTYGRLYYSSKGETLKDWRGLVAPTLDPYETINRALTNVANLTSFSDYKMTAVERWVKSFGNIIDEGSIPKDSSSMYKILNAKLVSGGGQSVSRLREGAEAQRDIIKRVLGWKTEADLRAEEYQRSLISWIEGSDPEGFRHNVVSGAIDWASNKDPVQKIRGMAFDMKLGLFNVGQFPKQISTMWAAFTLSPQHGFNGMMSLLPLRSYLLQSSGEEVLDHWLSKGVTKFAGFKDAEDFKGFMNSAKNSGFFDIGGNHQLINTHGPNAAISDTGNAIDKARQSARFFFNEAEIWNRSVAYRIAWNETREKLPQLALSSEEFNRTVAGAAEKYAFSMSDQSAAWWQKGVMSIPTQFWAYNARMMEAMLGGEFTRAQRVRLLMGQTLMYGSAGMPVTAFVADQIKSHKPPNGATLDTFWGALDRGMLDEIVYHISGSDLAIGKTQGTGNWLPDTIKDVFGLSQYGEKSLAEFAGGATGSVVGSTVMDSLAAFGAFATAMTGGDGFDLTKDRLLKVASNVSTVNNAMKAYMLYKYGTLKTAKGTTVGSDLPSVDAFGVALGFSPGEYDHVDYMMAYMKNQSQQVADAAKVINNYKTDYVNQPDNRQEIMAEINAFTKMLDPVVLTKALRRSHGSTAKSLYESLAKQMEKERTQRAMIKNTEEGFTGASSN